MTSAALVSPWPPNVDSSEPRQSYTQHALNDANTLSIRLQEFREKLYPPSAGKTLRKFSSGEASKLLGISDTYLRQIVSEPNDKLSEPERTPGGRLLFSLGQIHAVRRRMAEFKPSHTPTRRAGEKLSVIAISNFKGGSGKTTTTAHLVQYLAMRGYRTLAIDLDPQASLSAMFGLQPEYDVGTDQSIYGAMRYDTQRKPLSDVIRPTYMEGVDLIPANIELQEFEHDTARFMRSPGGGATFFNRMASVLREVEDRYEVVVVDCPPQLGFLTLSALCTATAAIITVHPQMLDVASMSQFLAMKGQLLQVIENAGGNSQIDWFRYLITRYEPNDAPQTQIVTFLRGMFTDRVLTNMMLKSTAISDAGLSRLTLYEAGRESMNRQTYDRALDSLNAVNEEVELLIRRAWGRVAAQ
jgi:chromosome partitioning protein